jgi:hypothetical protein
MIRIKKEEKELLQRKMIKKLLRRVVRRKLKRIKSQLPNKSSLKKQLILKRLF